jgi:hypothetical protein
MSFGVPRPACGPKGNVPARLRTGTRLVSQCRSRRTWESIQSAWWKAGTKYVRQHLHNRHRDDVMTPPRSSAT